MGQYSYTSDLTQFMQEYLDGHPAVAASRLVNRGKLWDVELKRQEEAEFKAASLPAKPYPYQTE